MKKSNVDGYYSLNNIHTSDLRANIYDRISRMAEKIGDMKSELAREKELLSIEKIKTCRFIPNNNRIQPTFPTYNSTQQLPIYSVYDGQTPTNHQKFAHYEAQQYYQNMNPNQDTYSQNYSLERMNNIETERQIDSFMDNLNLSQSEKEILENEKRKIQINFKQQLANIEKQFNMEKMQVQKNMDTLFRVSEQMLPRSAENKRKIEHRKHGENYIRR